MNEEERDEMYWAIHQDQDDRGWFDDLACSFQDGPEDWDEDSPF
jgi:major membrane immunogen (membrane-anchored lipoprotein)